MIRVEWCFNEQVLLPLPLPSQRTLPSQNDHGNFFSSGILLPIAVRNPLLQFVSTARSFIESYQALKNGGRVADTPLEVEGLVPLQNC